jgi:hypothetical protein
MSARRSQLQKMKLGKTVEKYTPAQPNSNYGCMKKRIDKVSRNRIPVDLPRFVARDLVAEASLKDVLMIELALIRMCAAEEFDVSITD